MKKHYFLGLNARRRHAWRHLLTFGSKRDYLALEEVLGSKYGGKAVLTKNGRTGLAMALKAYFKPGDKIIVNGFTCYAVVEAVKAAGCVPVYADISRETLNFNDKTLRELMGDASLRSGSRPCGIIIQNTLGNTVDIKTIEKFAKEHNLVIIEDLAHCVWCSYPDGRECGTVGAAVALSFGKDKAIDTISGGAVVFRVESSRNGTPRGFRSAAARDGTPLARGDGPSGRDPEECRSTTLPRLSDSLRSRWYPLFAGAVRGLSRVHLGGVLMRLFLKLHWVEKSADNRLDFKRTLTKTAAKEALAQLKTARGVDRSFYLVNERDKCLEELKKAGYHLAGFWYEKPVSPERYYKKVNFPEAECPEAVFIAEHIINLPTYYSRADLAPALKIVKKYLIKEGK